MTQHCTLGPLISWPAFLVLSFVDLDDFFSFLMPGRSDIAITHSIRACTCNMRIYTHMKCYMYSVYTGIKTLAASGTTRIALNTCNICLMLSLCSLTAVMYMYMYVYIVHIHAHCTYRWLQYTHFTYTYFLVIVLTISVGGKGK